MSTVRIGICQVFVVDGDRGGNFVRIERGIAEAKEGGAEIACLPETAILGWVNPDAHKRAYAIPGEDSRRLCKLAAEYGIHLCVGLEEKEADALYDSAVLIDDLGRILTKHRKIILLAELMEPPYTAGAEIGAVKTRFGRVGMLICADTHEDAILKRMRTAKPDLLLIPYGYAAPEEDWPEHGAELERVVRNAAKKTGAVVVGTNSVGAITNGPWRGRVYGGQSVIADKNGQIMARARDRDRDVVVIAVEIGGKEG